jgi:D-sedoheptulose 7-phosphate isomerase
MKPSATAYLDDCIGSFPVLASCKKDIENAFGIIVACFLNGGKVLTCGNGGSAADADHIVGELMNKFALKRPLTAQDKQAVSSSDISRGEKDFLLCHLQRQLPAISLSAHSPLVTAIANDEDALMIFGQQVFGYGKPGDVLIALSTSGNSKNVVVAVQVAKIFGLRTICFTGKSGGALKNLGTDVCICVPEEITYKIQQLHQPVYHCLCAMVEAELF